MSFGLKNARTTFQQLLDKTFKEIRRNLEVYFDYILVKSKREKDHLQNLKETFKNLSEVGLRIKA